MGMDSEASMNKILELKLLDASVEPADLPLSFLKAITNNFSNGQRIGSGGFAVVYKGQLKNGMVIAVKKLSEEVDIDEKIFIQEVTSLIKVKHTNIVRFLGYCSDTQGKVETYEGKAVMADIRQRLLCFEFLSKGSLQQYITDASEGLEWRMRYKIIKGICEGLHYLHRKNIVHLDLKPGNILLNYSMVPKIADFGLARCFDDKQTQTITSNLRGSLGYMAPESFCGILTLKSDIYSLGVIMIEILTGQKVFYGIDNVLDSWRQRFKSWHGDKRLELVRICTQIATECIDDNPARRPDIRKILDRLDETEHTYGTSSGTHVSRPVSGLVDKITSIAISTAPSPLHRIISVPKGHGERSTEMHFLLGSSESSKLLDVHPLELRFPFEPNKHIECLVSLTNRTDHYGCFWITPTCQNANQYYPHEQKYSLMEPHSTYAVPIIKKKQQQQPPWQERDKFEVMIIVVGSEDGLEESWLSSKPTLDSNLLEQINALGGELHRAMLTAVICEPASQTHQVIPETLDFGDISSMDVHPTETWVLTSYERGYIVISNYHTEAIVRTLQITKEPSMFDWWSFMNMDATCYLYSAKFIGRKQWFVTGDGYGVIHVYDYTTMDKVNAFKAHRSKNIDSLAVHPTLPLLLSASKSSSLIKLWDWDLDWVCIRTFDIHSGCVWDLTFDPRDIHSFACGSWGSGEVKVWNIRSSNPIKTFLCGHSRCVDYLFTGSGFAYK